MEKPGTALKPLRKHLISAQTLARSAAANGHVDLTRHHGQGNGIRMHLVYFVVVSLFALVALIAAIAIAPSMR